MCVSLSEEWRYDEIWDGKYMTCVSCLMQLLVHALVRGHVMSCDLSCVVM